MKTINDLKVTLGQTKVKGIVRYPEPLISYEDLRNLLIERCKEIDAEGTECECQKEVERGDVKMNSCWCDESVKQELMRLGNIKEEELR
jgi:hypothetical protein